jgi:hypothetical protein
MEPLNILLVATLVLIGYSLVADRISRSAQPLRVRVVDSIESLSTDVTLPESVRTDLLHLTDHLFSSKSSWLVVLLLPFALVASFTFDRDRSPDYADHPRRAEIQQTIGLGIFCMVANSPLCVVLFALEVIISMIFIAPRGMLMRVLHSVASVGDRLSMRAI